MYVIQTGINFEADIFGHEVYKWRPSREINGPEDFGWAVREFLKSLDQGSAPSLLINISEEIELVAFFVNRYLRKSLKLEVDDFKIVSARGSALDRVFGVDGLIYARINGVDCVVTIDAYAANWSEVEELTRESCCYSDFQSRIFARKIEKKIEEINTTIRAAEESKTLKPNNKQALLGKKERLNTLMMIGRPGNHLIFTPRTVRFPRGLKTFSREVAVALWQQVYGGRDLKYCPISGYTRPASS